MANKKIRTDAPDTVAGVRRRAAKLDPDKPSFEDGFNALTLDTLVGIAEGGKEGFCPPGDPREVAREVLRFGASCYDDQMAWITWPDESTEED